MENKLKAIGKEIKAFKFEDKDYPKVGWVSPEMDNYIRKIGIIEAYDDELDSYEIYFEDKESWDYPAELVKQQL